MVTSIRQLCDPKGGSLLQAFEAAKRYASECRTFEFDVSRFLQLECLSRQPNFPVIHRGLEILEAIVDEKRVLAVLRPFLRSPDPLIVSKCVVLLGRRCHDLAWMRSVMSEEDHRVRANLIESLWKRLDKEVEPILESAVRDRHHRVSANAVYGLLLAGSDKYQGALDQLLIRQDAAARLAAVWVLKSGGTNEAAARIRSLIRDPDEFVRHAAFSALASLRERAREGAAPNESCNLPAQSSSAGEANQATGPL